MTTVTCNEVIRMADPTQRRAETRQRILTAAGHLFREHGVDGVGVDAVMKEAGLTHGGFYLHFPSKDALAAEVSQSLLEQAARTMGPAQPVRRTGGRRLRRLCAATWSRNGWRRRIAVR